MPEQPLAEQFVLLHPVHAVFPPVVVFVDDIYDPALHVKQVFCPSLGWYVLDVQVEYELWGRLSLGVYVPVGVFVGEVCFVFGQ